MNDTSDLHYCQYAFATPECRVREIGPGVDPHYGVELIREGPMAAVVSRVDPAQFAPERLKSKTTEDIQWLGKIAARHNEIICLASASSAVLPLRLGMVFRSRDSLLKMLASCRSTVAEFLEQLGDRQEWGVKLYLANRHLEPLPGHGGPPAPHYREGSEMPIGGRGPSTVVRQTDNVNRSRAANSGIAHLIRRYRERSKLSELCHPYKCRTNQTVQGGKPQWDDRRELRARVYQTIQTVEQRLADKAEYCCRIRNLLSDLTGRSEDLVFNAAFLLSRSVQSNWLETIQYVDREVNSRGLALEVSGPWPPYHFCPSLEL